MAGNVHVGGQSWSLEGCGEKCYLWIKQTSTWKDEQPTSVYVGDRALGRGHNLANYTRLRVSGSRLDQLPVLQTAFKTIFTILAFFTNNDID